MLESDSFTLVPVDAEQIRGSTLSLDLTRPRLQTHWDEHPLLRDSCRKPCLVVQGLECLEMAYKSTHHS